MKQAVKTLDSIKIQACSRLPDRQPKPNQITRESEKKKQRQQKFIGEKKMLLNTFWTNTACAAKTYVFFFKMIAHFNMRAQFDIRFAHNFYCLLYHHRMQKLFSLFFSVFFLVLFLFWHVSQPVCLSRISLNIIHKFKFNPRISYIWKRKVKKEKNLKIVRQTTYTNQTSTKVKWWCYVQFTWYTYELNSSFK